MDFMRGFGYPEEWIKEGEKYSSDDSYVITKGSWTWEQIPPIPLISIYDLWKKSVEKYPDQIAVIFLDKKITYREMDLLINKYAALLLDLGVKKGDVVATMLPNSFQHWVAFFGATRIGAVHTPINVMYRETEIAYQLKDSGAKVVVTLDLFYYLYFQSLKEEIGLNHIIVTNLKDFASASTDPETLTSLKPFWDAPKSAIEGTVDLLEAFEKYEPTAIKVDCDPKEEMALLLYTAGTTGGPKGVICTHFNLVFNTLSHTHIFKMWKKREVNFSIMPMFHTAGYFLHTLPTFYQGGTVIPVPVFHSDETLRIIQDHKVTIIFAPPTFFIALIQNPIFRSYDLSSLELTIGCGAPVPVKVQKQWHQISGLTLTNGWGMTETNCGGIISAVGKKEKLDSLGVPVAAEVKIVHDAGSVVKRGEIGEIYFRGLQVAKGYLNKPAESRETFLENGWLATGDLGYIDEEDFIYFVDRKKDLIIASGYNIAPVEVEEVIYQHPAVLEVAVVGVPHPYRGETIKAFVALKPEYVGKTDEQEIKDLCKGKLATFKVPTEVEFIDEIPKNVVGKALRRVLRQREIDRQQAED